jgi:hypothetical protein
MSEYIPKPYPCWLFHEVLPDKIAQDVYEAERLEAQGYTREKLEGRDALMVRLEYHRAEVRLLEEQLGVGVTASPVADTGVALPPSPPSSLAKRGPGRPRKA